LHETIKKVSDDMGRRHTFNTAIAANMELTNQLQSFEDASVQGVAVRQETLEAIILMLAPIIPHVCHMMWQRLGNKQAIYEVQWPEVDASALKKDDMELVVQVNGKKRATITVPMGIDKQEIEAAALNDGNVKKFTEDKIIAKVIIVPGRLVNVVVK
jgi:leucyl-tRNA synthetase